MEAVCPAAAVSKTGEEFTDIGDANPKNCNRTMAPHPVRMAGTRAKARAFRRVDRLVREFGRLDGQGGCSLDPARSEEGAEAGGMAEGHCDSWEGCGPASRGHFSHMSL